MHTGSWAQDHMGRCEFFGSLGIGMETTGCLCKACTTSIICGTKIFMEEGLPRDYVPQWCKGKK